MKIRLLEKIKNRRKNPFLKFFLFLVLIEILIIGLPFLYAEATYFYELSKIKTGIISCQGIECAQSYECVIYLNPHSPDTCSWEEYQLNKLSGSQLGSAFLLILGLFILFLPVSPSPFLQMLPFVNLILLFFISYIIFRKKHKELKFASEIKRPVNIAAFSLIIISLFTMLIASGVDWNEVRIAMGKKTKTTRTTKQYQEETKRKIDNNKNINAPNTEQEETGGDTVAMVADFKEENNKIFTTGELSFRYYDKICVRLIQGIDEKILHASPYECHENTQVVRTNTTSLKNALETQADSGKFISIVLAHNVQTKGSDNSGSGADLGDIVINFITKEEYDKTIKKHEDRSTYDKNYFKDFKTTQSYKVYNYSSTSDLTTHGFLLTDNKTYLKITYLRELNDDEYMVFDLVRSINFK